MIIDIIFALLVAIALFHGWQKGFISSVVSVLAIAIALVAAIKFSEVASLYISDHLNISGKYLPIISLVAVFLLVLILFRAMSSIVEGLLKAVQLGFINRIAGGMLWAGLTALMVSTLVWYLDGMGIFADEVKADSKTYPTLIAIAPEVITGVGEIIPFVQDSFDSLEVFFDELALKAGEKVSAQQ